MPKLTGNIEVDHNYLVLSAVAGAAVNSACNEVRHTVGEEASERVWSVRNVLINDLVKQSKEHYAAQIDQAAGKHKELSSFRKVKTSEQFRDWHHTFMRHWLAAILVRKHGFSVNDLKRLSQGAEF